MKVRVVRNREGQVVCAVQLEQTASNEVLVEPVLEDGEEAEDIEVTQSDLINLQSFFTTYSKVQGGKK